MSDQADPSRGAGDELPSVSGELVRRAEVGEIVGRLSEPGLSGRDRVGLLGRLTAALTAGARSAGGRAALSGRHLADVVIELAPHLAVRDLVTLREHHRGLSGHELAEALVVNASRTTAAIGAAGGALATAQYAAPPSLVAAPVRLVAETVAVVGVELKLVAELHVVFGRAPTGNRAQQATVWLESWAGQRGVDVRGGLPSLSVVLGTAARQQLRSRLVRRLGRSLSTMAPFLVGALAGAEVNRRETRSLGDKLMKDLRRSR